MDKIAKWFGIFDVLLILFSILINIRFDLSLEIISFLVSLCVGVTFFVFFVFIFIYVKNIILLRKSKNKKINYEATNFIYILGSILSMIIIIFVFNSSLYIQALTGNDLFLSLDLDKENFIVNNGDSFLLSADFGIVANLFCSANCNLSLRDLSTGDVLFFEETPVFVSSSASREYEIFVNESYAGQKLYSVGFECVSQRGMFCYTSIDKPKHANKIISVEHLLNKEQNLSLAELKYEISYLNSNYNQLILNLEEMNNTILNSSCLNLSKFIVEINVLTESIENDGFDFVMSAYNKQDFSKLKILLQEKEVNLNKFNKSFSDINNSVNYEINSYNRLVNDFYSLRKNVSSLYFIDVDNSSLLVLNNFIDNFNSKTISFNNFSDLKSKETILQNLVYLEGNLSFHNLSSESFRLEKPLNDINFSYLSLNFSVGNFSLSFNNPSSICCLFNKCDICLDENFSSFNYPIILLHGHGFNEQVSALGSLSVFDSFQESLEKDGFVNAGSLIYLNYDNSSKGVLGKINNSVTIKASYYFDVLSTEQGYSLLETKTDNIDTYSIRLKDIIENVKYITGKDKVIIVAHSMGGLVARRYIQVFGEGSIDKLILITVPNKGVDGFVVDYCSLLGTEDECGDMNSNSLFLNKLNRGSNPDIPIYNIIGEGCAWENSNGDGIVKNNSAYLSFAKNYYVNGTCNGFDYFHTIILDVESYPEAYKIVKENLEN